MNVIQIASYIGATTAIIATAWATGDYLRIRPILQRDYAQLESQQQLSIEKLQEQQLQANRSYSLLRAEFLISQTKYRNLDFIEQQELCRLAKELEWYSGVPGCATQ
jgi:hypothetical protein